MGGWRLGGQLLTLSTGKNKLDLKFSTKIMALYQTLSIHYLWNLCIYCCIVIIIIIIIIIIETLQGKVSILLLL